MLFYKFCKFIVWLYFHIFYKVKVKGLENIPDTDGAIICPNHFSLMDPLFVAISIPREIRFMAKYETFKYKLFGILLSKLGVYPVRRGEADLNAIKNTLKFLKDNQLIGLFPEGTRVKSKEMGKANPGVALFSIKTGKVIIPVLITGSYKFFTKLCIVFGQPLDLTQYKKEKMTNDDYMKISQIVMEKIKELKREEI